MGSPAEMRLAQRPSASVGQLQKAERVGGRAGGTQGLCSGCPAARAPLFHKGGSPTKGPSSQTWHILGHSLPPNLSWVLPSDSDPS